MEAEMEDVNHTPTTRRSPMIDGHMPGKLPSRYEMATLHPQSMSSQSLTPLETPDQSLEVLGKEPKILLRAISELEHFGVDSTIPLPKIVVVGDQSAGKSSLIEAMSEIKVPRDSGICTRCVVQITLRCGNGLNAHWVCHVSLVKRYTYDPNSDRSDTLYPWVEQAVPSITNFGNVHDKDKLEELIRLAQVATLNPQTRPESFLNTSYLDHSRKVEFSPNVVAIEIVAPNAPNLSFYDLPGVISQTKDVSKVVLRSLKSVSNIGTGPERHHQSRD
jgi:hypothetical protein